MITPNSAARPAKAMKPTAVATEMSWPSRYTSQTPPMSANGSVSRMIAGCRTRLKAMNNRKKMMLIVAGTTSLSRSPARCAYSNWPDQATE